MESLEEGDTSEFAKMYVVRWRRDGMSEYSGRVRAGGISAGRLAYAVVARSDECVAS